MKTKVTYEVEDYSKLRDDELVTKAKTYGKLLRELISSSENRLSIIEKSVEYNINLLEIKKEATKRTNYYKKYPDIGMLN